MSLRDDDAPSFPQFISLSFNTFGVLKIYLTIHPRFTVLMELYSPLRNKYVKCLLSSINLCRWQIHDMYNCQRNAMKKRPSSQADSRLAFKEIQHLSWNPKFDFFVDKSPHLDLIPNQMNHVHTLKTYSLTSILILSSHIRLGLSILRNKFTL
jgi:hypothetical protein